MSFTVLSRATAAVANGTYWLEACKAGSRFTARGEVDAGMFAGTFSIGMTVTEFRCE